MGVTINRDEWLRALAEAGYPQEDDQSALTAAEFASMFNIPRQTANDRLGKLIRCGKAVRTTKSGLATDGRRIMFVAYRLTSQ